LQDVGYVFPRLDGRRSDALEWFAVLSQPGEIADDEYVFASGK
jgi:hypothetical protein